MARRRLLTAEQWANFQAVPTDERELVHNYTLSRDDLDTVTTKRTARNRLGYAVLLCYLRHPGRVPDPDEIPPSALLTFVAHQVQGNELMGSFAQRYVKRHGLTQPFQADFEGLSGYGQGEHLPRAVLPILTS
jgi:TnpA family transposase